MSEQTIDSNRSIYFLSFFKNVVVFHFKIILFIFPLIVHQMEIYYCQSSYVFIKLKEDD